MHVFALTVCKSRLSSEAAEQLDSALKVIGSHGSHRQRGQWESGGPSLSLALLCRWCREQGMVAVVHAPRHNRRRAVDGEGL